MGMEHALIVSSSTSTTTLFNAQEARQTLHERTFDLVMINAPLRDETGEQLALSIITKTTSEVLLMVKEECYEEISQRMEKVGILTIPKPIHHTLLWNALKLSIATHQRFLIMHEQQQHLLQTIEDIRVIDRAKCILIANFSMPEHDAHRYIEKQAMDMRMTRREVADKIVQLYGH